jgi:hypothetical protein
MKPILTDGPRPTSVAQLQCQRAQKNSEITVPRVILIADDEFWLTIINNLYFLFGSKT